MDLGYDAQDIDSIVAFARRLVGRSIEDAIDGVDRTAISGVRTKGRVGAYYERYFGIPPNSLQEPDFGLADVELKIVPLKGSVRRVKERTFITQINYGLIHEEPWRTSHLNRKSEKILLLFYHWRPDVPMSSFITLGAHLWERAPIDDVVLRGAHGYVRKMVLEGQAHNIGEGDTPGVGAATKGAGGEWITQPFSSEKAKRRAFAFRASFMQAVWDEAQRRLESIPVEDAVSSMEFEDRLKARLDRYRGKTVEQIVGELGTTLSGGKNALAMIARRMMGAPEGKRDIKELQKMGILLKLVRIDERGRPKEDTSFPKMDFLEVVNETWEDSTLRDQVSHIMFVVFRQVGEDVEGAKLEGAFLWRPSDAQERTMKSEWEKFLHHIRTRTLAERPQATHTQILHIRPHARDGADCTPLPGGGEWVKSSFWLNKDFVSRLIADHRQR